MTCCRTISSMPVRATEAAVARLAGLSSWVTTSARRSAWVRAAWPSSRTTSGSSAAAIISSSRIDKAVSGVRSWCEASTASSRSAASRRLSLRADVSSPSATWSRSASPYRRPSGRGSPAPSRAAASASSSTGRASRPASTAVSQPASAAAATIATAITTSAVTWRPAPTTRAGTPTMRTAMTVTAKLENHSLLRIGHPGARPVDRAGPDRAGPDRAGPAASVAAFKAEPDAADRGDVPGAVRVVAELAAQPGNVHVERLGRRPPLGVPDLAHDLLAGDHLARLAQQDPQQVEFLGGQVELDLTVPGSPGIRVDPHAERGRSLRRPAPQQGPDPGQQFGQPERLGDVIVGARVEADHRVHFVGPCGEDQHGYGIPTGPDPPTHLEPVEFGQADVEQDQVDAFSQRPVERARPVRRDVHLVSLPPQRAGQGFGDRGIVLGEQHASHK